MRRSSTGLMAIACAVVLLTVSLGHSDTSLGHPATHEGATRTEGYVGGSIASDLFISRTTAFCRPNPAGKNVGQVCFSGLTAGRYKITIHDDSGQDVGFIPRWDGAWDYDAFACNTVTLTKPRYASALVIFLEGPIGHGGFLTSLYCQRNGLPYTPGFATTGEVTLTKLAR
jgi:hypothetical protein